MDNKSKLPINIREKESIHTFPLPFIICLKPSANASRKKKSMTSIRIGK